MPSEAFERIVRAVRERGALALPLDERRAATEAAVGFMPPPDDVTFTDAHAGGVPAEWVEAPGASRDRVVLYLHGGAYVICSPRTHRRLTAGISREAQARVLAIDYRLAPEHPFPAAVDDAIAAYRWLLERTPSEHIAIAGDSAGGGLTLATLVRLRDERLPLPGCAIAISPWVDLELTGDSVSTLQDEDPMLDATRLKESADMYLAGTDVRSPLASPIYANLSGLPPLLIHVAGKEILLDDATRLEARAKEHGVEVTMQIAPDMCHVWHIFTGYVPESDEAVRAIGNFVRAKL